jgi:hypothetical protein
MINRERPNIAEADLAATTGQAHILKQKDLDLQEPHKVTKNKAGHGPHDPTRTTQDPRHTTRHARPTTNTTGA